MQELIVAGAALIGFNMGITQKIKGVFNVNPELVSLIVGAIIGPLAYIYTRGVPEDLVTGVGMAIFCIAAIFAPSGGFELIDGFRRE